ncbi:MAG: biopolymer transporter ExbD [Myxococcota bacterium]
MSKKPSERRNFKEEEMELNLTPMMNLIAILIPALLVSTVFVEIAVVNVSAPAIGAPSADQEEKPPDKPPLNLTVTVTDKGYTVAGAGGVLGEEEAAAGGGPTIPLVQRSTSCKRFVGTWAPPRSKNRSSPKCEKGDDSRNYWVYDTEALQRKLMDIKEAFPDERRMIIAAEPDVEFEAITNVMDSGREVKDPAGETQILFDEVVLSPGLS